MKEYISFRRNGQAIDFLKYPVEFSGNAFLPQRALVPISVNEVTAFPVVTVGQYVEEGQLIARARDNNSSNLHSPVPGTVADPIRFQTDYGSKVECLPILLGGYFEIFGKHEERYTWQKISALVLLKIIDDKGLIITEKPFRPLATKLRDAIRLGVKNMQVTLFDFDASCGLEEVLLEHFFLEVIEGLAILAKIIDCKIVEFFYLNQLDAEKEEKILEFFNFTEVVFTHTKNNYPFYDITKKQKQPTFTVLPSTAIYVYDAIVKNRPFISSYILLSGSALKNPKLLKVKLGTPIGSLIEECDGLIAHPASIIINGFLEGVLTESFDLPTSKNVKSVTIIPSNYNERVRSINCNSCGTCIASCPMHLNPAMLVRKIKRGIYDQNVLMQLRACIKCTVCSSCCECRIPLSSIIAKAKEDKGL